MRTQANEDRRIFKDLDIVENSLLCVVGFPGNSISFCEHWLKLTRLVESLDLEFRVSNDGVT